DTIKPAFIHVFPYSRRANTPAAEMPNQVHEATKTARVEAHTYLSEELHKAYIERHRGTVQEVLFE
ncbi:MAG: tRNA (N(6)-L-threonylcarbamoyladenosine(37)-C(2))-methylthiotransferase MtaB, partial [Bacteroidales bacterium]|nr:tRNA (N(6)-L-threonylcarbamoyladenosine(37)-C(2))-methylthiotransferase MtaB [Bacteroidales bacterium]